MSKELCTKIEKYHGDTTIIVVAPLTVGGTTTTNINKWDFSITISKIYANTNIYCGFETQKNLQMK